MCIDDGIVYEKRGPPKVLSFAVRTRNANKYIALAANWQKISHFQTCNTFDFILDYFFLTEIWSEFSLTNRFYLAHNLFISLSTILRYEKKKKQKSKQTKWCKQTQRARSVRMKPDILYNGRNCVVFQISSLPKLRIEYTSIHK